MADLERELDWGDKITKDAQEYELFPEGDYDFIVESFERGRHGGSEKLPPCNMAVLRLRIKAEDGRETSVTHRLFLHTRTEGMLSAFFTSIGQKKKGEALTMNWNMVPGSTGRLKLGIHEYQKDGETRKSNDVKRFYPKEQRAYKAGDF